MKKDILKLSVEIFKILVLLSVLVFGTFGAITYIFS